MILPGCGDNGAEGAQAAAPQRAEVLFDRAIRQDGCEVLTAEIVSRVVAVDADDLLQLSMGTTCIYKWDGGEVSLMSLSVEADSERAGAYFDNAYRTMTAEEAAEAGEALRQQMDRQVAEGSLTREQADMASRIGAMAGSAAATRELEVIPGVGDRAVYDATERTIEGGFFGGDMTSVESQLGVLLGNIVFDIQAHLSNPDQTMDEIRAGPSQEARQRNREVTLEVGRAVVDRLLAMR